MKSTPITANQITDLASILAEHGFEPPYKAWLEIRLHRLGWQFDVSLARRDVANLTEDLQYFEDLATGIKKTKSAIDRYSDYLLANKIHSSPDWTTDNEWQVHENIDDLEVRILPPEFTLPEIMTTKRVLSYIEDIVSGSLSFHRENFSRRPARNERPELNVVIGGIVRIWCQAMNIPEKDIKISASAGSPAMKFIEAGAGIFLKNLPQREGLERHVIAYRNARRLETS